MILEQVFDKKRNFQEDRHSESPSRSVIKSVSWRLLGTLDTFLISWLVTGETTVAFSIGSIEIITKMILYFFHERLWDKIKWGKL